MTIAVIDGQGGRMGALLVEAMRRAGIGAPHRVLAIGTNALATSAMLKAGADQGATGANPVIVASRTADLIVGPIGILMADALLGEITPEMAVAVGRSSATKLLLPVNQCSSIVAGTQQLTLAQLIDSAVAQIAALAARG
ncbi:MAG: DUF3842 family protein [Clostridiales bacterium]|nr:DUF3842 family protein [Clostridiales bacterium]MDY5514393.1 DUF3842 family protein [Candidatus Ventricola sp.]